MQMLPFFKRKLKNKQSRSAVILLLGDLERMKWKQKINQLRN